MYPAYPNGLSDAIPFVSLFNTLPHASYSYVATTSFPDSSSQQHHHEGYCDSIAFVLAIS